MLRWYNACSDARTHDTVIHTKIYMEYSFNVVVLHVLSNDNALVNCGRYKTVAQRKIQQRIIIMVRHSTCYQAIHINSFHCSTLHFCEILCSHEKHATTTNIAVQKNTRSYAFSALKYAIQYYTVIAGK